MPIINIQRRMAEQGRIRLGQKVTGTSRQGKEYTRPEKLDRFRFTSPNRGLIEQIAATYGGEANPWDNDGKAEWEVITDARSIPVIVVKGGFSQWYELWSKAGCLHRCDGEKDATGTYCDPDDAQHIQATEKPTTRLSVMLSEIETLGVWRMESKGWNAAAELPSMAELAMHVGDLVPATLSLAERSSIVEGPRGPQTSRFVVPVLDLHITKARLVELVGGQSATPAIGAGPDTTSVPALPAGPEVADEWIDRIADATTTDECRDLWNEAKSAGLLYPKLQARISDRVREIEAEQQETAPPAGPSREDVWMQLVLEAGRRSITDSELRELLEQEFAQPVADLDADQLAFMLEHVKNAPVTA